MIRLICLLAILLPPAVFAQDEEPFPPKAYPLDRYKIMMERSPFVLPTVAAPPPVVVTPEWTNDFRIVSVVMLGDDSFVLAKKVSTDERIPIRKLENAQGIRLVDLRMSPDPHNVSANIEMGGKQGTITYDESILSGIPRSQAPGNPALKTE